MVLTHLANLAAATGDFSEAERVFNKLIRSGEAVYGDTAVG